MKQTVLVVTRSDDNASVERVMRSIEARGLRAVRLDTDRYPYAVDVTTRFDRARRSDAIGVRHTMKVADGVASSSPIDLADVVAMWHRRFAAGLGLPEALGDLRAACVDESRRTLLGVLASLDCVHVDTLDAMRRCDHKELQLALAAKHGLRVPRTIITNDAMAARAFVDEVGDVVTKMQSSFAIVRDRREHVVFTSAISHADTAHLDDELRFCPMIFQERIRSAFDVRATVVGDRVLSAALPATRTPTPLPPSFGGGSGDFVRDWRSSGAARAHEWKPWQLPKRVEASLLRAVRAMGLHYAACDFVVDGDGEHWFLEMNAGGEWLWLDDVLGIAEALAELLTNPLRKKSRRAID